GDLVFALFEDFGELLFELSEAPALALDPFGLESTALLLELTDLLPGLALERFEFVPAAMQIGDQLRGLANFGRQLRAGALEDRLGQAQPSRDLDTARRSGNAHQ